jgi:hypothetical protein
LKIGIVTFHSGINYGAVLQAYALQTYLQKSGHEPFFINYKYFWFVPIYNPRAWFSRTPRGVCKKINDNILRNVFNTFRENHLILGSPNDISLEELVETPPQADAYICGSDQVWNPNALHKNDASAVWLRFGNETVRRISYAASFSVPDLDSAIRERWSRYAQCFHAISVREKDSVDLVKKLGRDDAIWVPDPTLLLDAFDYSTIEMKFKKPQSPYSFTYVLGIDNNELASNVTKTISEKLGMMQFASYPYSLSHNLFDSGFVGPTEWLARLHLSDFVVTNSFHGLMFSLIFRRPFIVLLRAQKAAEMNSRINSILEVVGLQNRAISLYDRAQVNQLCREEINWDVVHAQLAVFRETGYKFIREALG